MRLKRFPDLTYEEYCHAATHFLCRVERLIELGTVPIDQLIVKWYIVNVLKCDFSKKNPTAFLHQKYLGVIQKLIHDGLLSVQQ